MKAPNETEWLSGKDAAQILHVQPETLRQMHVRGDLSDVAVERTPGGQRRYNKADLEKRAAASSVSSFESGSTSSRQTSRTPIQKVTCPDASVDHTECELCSGSQLCWRWRTEVPGQTMRRAQALNSLTGWPMWAFIAALCALPELAWWISALTALAGIAVSTQGAAALMTARKASRMTQAMRNMRFGFFITLIGAVLFVFSIIDPSPKVAIVPALICIGKIIFSAVLARTRPFYDAVTIDRYMPYSDERPSMKSDDWQRA